MTQLEHGTSPHNAVHQAQKLFWMALKTRDQAAMERLLSADFVARSPDGPNQGRSEFIHSLTGFPGHVHSVGSDNLEIHFWGQTAVVTGVQSAEIEFPDGRKRNDKIAITNIYRHEQGRWLMKLAHAVSLA